MSVSKKQAIHDVPVDELCYCGHLRSEHGGIPPIQGHGACLAKEFSMGDTKKRPRPCICARFTWAKFVYDKKGA